MRLDKFISHASGLSRELARRAIRGRRVLVNGDCVRDSSFTTSSRDRIELDGQPLEVRGPRYLMLHKPAGYVCATEDAEHPIVLDLLTGIDSSGLSIGGRLDIDTTGLVLLSDDGQWLHRVTAPRHHVEKTYIATLAEAVDESLVARFAEGILLRGESRPTRPARCRPLPDNRAEVVLSEGRYHQVKRMFAACGNHVLALHRCRIADVLLDEQLQPGQYRSLNPDEIKSLP